MRNLIYFISVGLFLHSCAYHSGTIGELSTNGPVVYEDLAVGVATSNHFLGLGGITKDALLFDAKRSLMSNRPLNGNEFYGAFTVDVKHSFYLLGYKTKITVTADVVRSVDSPDESHYSHKYLSKNNYPLPSPSIFSVGDSVYCKGLFRVGIIQSFKKTNDIEKAQVLFTDNMLNSRIRTISLAKLYTTKNVSTSTIAIGTTYEDKLVIGIGIEDILLFGPNGPEIRGIKELHRR